MCDVLVAKKSSVFWWEGRRIRVRKGLTTVRRGHPILVGRESLFGPMKVDYDAPPAAAPAASAPASAPVPSAAVETAQVGVPEVRRPSQASPKASWVAWAVAAGHATVDEAEAMTKAELVALA